MLIVRSLPLQVVQKTGEYCPMTMTTVTTASAVT